MNIPRAVVAAVLAISLAGCAPEAAPPEVAEPAPIETPTPTPEPTKPTLSELVLTTEGLGDLVVGEPVPDTDPELALVDWDPVNCVVEGSGLSEGDPGAGSWVPTYDDGAFTTLTSPDKDGAIIVISGSDSALATDEGIALGSSVADVEAAYPDATLLEGELSTVYIVEGDAGKLLIEVAIDPADIPGYWTSSERYEVDHVIIVSAVAAAIEPYGVAGTGAGGPCTT